MKTNGQENQFEFKRSIFITFMNCPSYLFAQVSMNIGPSELGGHRATQILQIGMLTLIVNNVCVKKLSKHYKLAILQPFLTIACEIVQISA